MGKILVPTEFMPFYPKWLFEVSSPEWWIPLVALVALGAVLVVFRRSIDRQVFWALVNFLVPLLPVIGLFKFGFLAFSFVSDHFAYLSVLGMAHLMGLFVDYVLNNVKTTAKYAFTIMVALYIGFLGLQTYNQTSVWESSVRLWSHNVERNPTAWKADSYLGYALCEAGKCREGLRYLMRAAEFQPNSAQVHHELATALKAVGDVDSATRAYLRAVEINPGYWEAQRDLGLLLVSSGNVERGIVALRRALTIRPGSAHVRYRLGVALKTSGRHQAAMKEFATAVRTDPSLAEAHEQLGLELLAGGETDEAIRHFTKAVRLKPDNARFHRSLARGLAQKRGVRLPGNP